MKLIILIIFQTVLANLHCQYLDDINSVDDSNYPQNYSIKFELEESILRGETNIGFGIWMKYEPFKTYWYEQISNSSRNFFDKDKIIIRQKEQFIFSMVQQNSSQLILSLSYKEFQNLFNYNIYTDFEEQQEIHIQSINPADIEGKWYIFYIYFDKIKQNSIVSFYNNDLNNWEFIQIAHTPQFTNQIEFQIGGVIRQQYYNSLFLRFQQFYGILTPVFTTYDYNLIVNDLGDCQFILENFFSCVDYWKTMLAYADGLLNGQNYLSYKMENVNLKAFIINGWIKLGILSEKERETIIMRVTLNSNYNDDENIGDRFIYLQYFQNSIPNLNGLKISTQGYKTPVFHKYQTQPSDIREDFNEVYYSKNLLTKWHFIQFERGSLNNNGFPLFSLYFPDSASRQLKWTEQFNYFSQPTLYFYFGGDKFTKKYIKGYIQNFYYQEICNLNIEPVIITCHLTCETCNGPTENSCLSCSQENYRELDEQSHSCPCSDNYFDYFQIACRNFWEIAIVAQRSYEVVTVNECQSGYILIQNSCFQCPYYELFQSKLQIKCADCYINYKQFAKTLTCTFDYISYQYQRDFAYQKYNRSLDEIEIFKIDFIQQKLIKLESKFMKKSIKCQNGQIFQNEECITILDCNNFEIVNEIPLNCLSCNQGYSLNNNQCIQCGKFCSSCNSFGLCNFCLDSQQYYLTFDGINCNRCQIQYCKYCFQYYYKNNIMYSTLDIDFQLQKLQSNQIYEGCAQCNDNYFFNFQTNQCELKCQNLQNNNQKQQCLLQYQDCQFGVILTNSSIYCIQSQYSQISILYQDCNYFQNCYYCQNSQILNQIPKCIICKDGYYLELENEKCQSCPNECTTCYQQNIQQQDYWKQQIYGFYQLLCNQNGQHQFEEYSINYQQQQQIKCLGCIQGYVLYNNICIKDCDSSCTQCIIDQGQSVCIQCGKKYRGYMRSKSDQGTCYDCPNGCSACIDRDLLEIQDYNPYFILTQDNIKQTRKCFEVFEDKENSNQLFLDYQNFLVVQCNENSCMNQLKAYIDVYCSIVDMPYYSFGRIITFISELFQSYLYFEKTIIEILNKLSTREIDIFVNFIQGSAESCLIESNFQFNTQLQQQVFSLQAVHLHFLGFESSTLSLIKGKLSFHNFTNITFENLQIQFLVTETNQENQYEIFIQSISYISQLYFYNCIFTQSASQNKIILKLSYSSSKSYNLIIKNVVFRNIYISNSDIFSTCTSDQNILRVLIEDLLIENSILQNTIFYQILDNKKEQIYFINCSRLRINASKFENSSIFWIANLKGGLGSSIFINDTIIVKSEFINCIIFREPSVINFLILQVEISFCEFLENSYFINTQFVNITNLKLDSIQICNSTFISNNIFNSQENKPSIILAINFNKISFSNITSDNIKSLIQFANQKIKFQIMFILTELFLENFKSTSNRNTSDLSSYQQAIIYLDCYFCYISSVKIKRSFGVIEFALINSFEIKLDDINIQQDIISKRKVLHPNFQCVLKNLFPYQSTLIILFYKTISINNLFIMNCDVLNSPIISIDGYNIKENFVKEFIQITNSYFSKNNIIMLKPTKEASIIYINSFQFSKVQFCNVTFDGNILNHYQQSLYLYSSSTILINLQQGYFEIQDSKFQNNLALNTTNSILFINTFQLVFQNIVFKSNNILKNSTIADSLFVEKISLISLSQYFSILSNGGNGYLIQHQIFIQNVSIENSKSNNGGCFYISTNGEGMIYIEGSSFSDSTSSFSNLNSSGGCLYIDASQSQLNFTMSNSKMNKTMGKNIGGAIYILPSKLINYIKITQIQVQDTYSLQHSFLSLLFPKSFNIVSSILLENILFYQTKNWFDIFLSKIENHQTLVLESPLIYINYGNVTLKNVTLKNSYSQYLLQIDEGQLIIISDLSLFNISTFLKTPIISITSKKDSFNQIYIKRLTLSNIQQQNDLNRNSSDECYSFLQKIEIVNCPNYDENFKTQILETNTSIIDTNSLICNKKLLYQTQQKIHSLISLVFQSNKNNFIFENSKLQFLKCKFCENGIIGIRFNQEQKGKILFKEIKMQQNTCGIHGCLSIVFNNQSIINSRYLIEESNQLIEIIHSNVHYEFIFENCLFLNNIANLGGALYLNNISCLIVDSIFMNNSAYNGGSIYYASNYMKLQLINSQIVNNVAEVAGGLFISQQVLGLSPKLNVYISNNFGSVNNQDISENPTSLTISFDGGVTLQKKKLQFNNSSQIIEKIVIKSLFILGQQQSQSSSLILPSGIPINQYSFFDQSKLLHFPYNLTFRVIALNQMNERENQLQNSFCTIDKQIIEISTENIVINNNITASISTTKIYFNNTSQDYNLDDLTVYFNPLYSQNYILRLIIYCNIILIPLFDANQTYTVINYTKNYQLYIDIQTLPCQIGEYLNLETGGCVYCDPSQNLYSLTNDSQNCIYKDDLIIEQLTSSSIQLRKFYWRAQNNSTKIEYCHHLQENCLGGWWPGGQSCIQGHIGALCEQCDLYDVRGQGSYSISSQYSCGNCNQIAGNIIIITLISTFVFISIYVTVYSTVKGIEQLILSLRLQFLGFSGQFRKVSTAVLVKSFINYLQIVIGVKSFELKTPDIIIDIYSSIGNPFRQMSYAWDCLILNFTNIDLNYFRIIWNINYMLIMIILFGLFEFGKYMIFKIQIKNSQIYTALLYLFIYAHPSILEMLISQLSYRKISDIKWVQANVSYKFEAYTHKLWLHYLIIPLSLIFGVIIPLYLFLTIYINRNQLDKYAIKKKWNYLINEYKQQFFFWDIVKILQRQIIVGIFTYYQDFILVKASLVVAILFIYSLLQASFQPYKTRKLNKVEGATMEVCSISIILSSCIYQAEQYQIKEIIWLFYFLVIYCNISLFCYFIFQIFSAYLFQILKMLHKLLGQYEKSCPKFILHLFQNTVLKRLNQKKKVENYFQKIRNSILPQAKSYLSFKTTLDFTFRSRPQIQFTHQTTESDQISTNQDKIKQLFFRPKINPNLIRFQNMD